MIGLVFVLLAVLSAGGLNAERADAANTQHPVREASPIVGIDHPEGEVGRVNATVEVAGRIFVGGDFTSIGGQPISHLAEIDPTTGDLIATFDLSVNGPVHDLDASPDGSTLYLGGRFKKIDGQSRTRLASLDLATNTVTDWNPVASAKVNAIATDGDVLIAGGIFTSIGGAPAERLAAIDTTTGELLPWGLSADDNVFALEWNEHDLVYVAGEFLDIGGSGQSHLASIDLAAGGVSDWRPTAPFFVWDIAVDPNGEWVYVAEGGSLSLGGNRLSKFHAIADGRPWWTRQADGDFQAVATDGTWVYGAGHMDFDGKGIEFDPDSLARTKILSVRATDGEITDWDPHFTGVLGIWDLEITSAGLIIGGDFHRVNWIRQGHLARFTGPQPSPLAAPPAIKPPPLPDAECTTQFGGDYRTISVVSFQAPDELAIRRNGTWHASPPIDELVFTEFAAFGGGWVTQWNFPHDLETDGSLLTRMSVDGGPRLELQCTEGAPIVAVPPLAPPPIPVDPDPGPASCTVTTRLVEWDVPVDDRVIVRRNGSWAHTASAGTLSWTDPQGTANDTYLIRFVEHGERRDVTCERVAGDPDPEPTCSVRVDGNDQVVVEISLVREPRAVVVRRNGSWLITLQNDLTQTWVDEVNSAGDYVARIRESGGVRYDLACGTI